jgi:predicted nucleotidyltransferase component of viral defense system
MTHEVKNVLEKIKNNTLFQDEPIFFTGGTALSTYLNHRISYDLDFICNKRLPTYNIKSFAFSIGAKIITNRAQASAFRINKGEDLENFHLKFMLDDVKIEFSFFDDFIIEDILSNATLEDYNVNSKLKKLGLEDIAKLKAVALFKRKKARDLFDMAMILKERLLTIDELEQMYDYSQKGNISFIEYIETFGSSEEDMHDASLDFLSHHTHYKEFAKLSQHKRFNKSKEMLLSQYEKIQKEKLENRQKEVMFMMKQKR